MTTKGQSYHRLNIFSKELCDNIRLLVDEVENDKMPNGVLLWERPIRIKNGYLRVGYNKERNDFYLHGKNSDGQYVHIML